MMMTLTSGGREVDKVWWVQPSSLMFTELYRIYRDGDLIMWQSHPPWELSRNFLWLSLLSSFSYVFLLFFLCLPSPPLHLQARCHPSLLSLISSSPPYPPSSHDGGWVSVCQSVCVCVLGRGGCPVYAIPLVLKWQAGDRYAILKRGLMNFWHLISCFPVNISWLAGAWSAPLGPLWSAGYKKKGPLPPLMYSPLM